MRDVLRSVGRENRYNRPVEPAPWDALAAAFAADDLVWRVVALSPDRLSAQVKPSLRAASVRARFDRVCGVGGWSCAFAPLGDRGLVCTLTVGGTYKAAVAPYSAETGLESTADDAFAAAATLFGLCPPVTLDELPWVDYDPEQKEPLYDPELSGTAPEAVPEPERASEPAPPEPEPVKSAGQQAIDKLVDRLKADGKGLGAAKLLNAYGGYGSDPAAARELYAKLRELLLQGSAA